MTALPFLLVYVTPIILIGAYYSGLSLFSLPIFIFFIVPLLDFLVGRKNTFFTKHYVPTKETHGLFKWILYGFVFVQLMCVIWALYIVKTEVLSITEWFALALSLAMITGGVGINMAHELNHKPEWINKRCADLLLIMVNYAHFNIQHLYGHHKNVATPKDPATAKKNEWVHIFVIKSIIMTYLEAWQIEAARLHRNNQAFFSMQNKMLSYTLFQAGIFLSLCLYDPKLALFFAAQSFIAIVLLEIVNYIEHYGLTRKKHNNGQYEKVSDQHSWNSSYLVSNWFLFNLQLHSDHHENALKWYPNLRIKYQSPELPCGYPIMMLTALFCPPLWFMWMNPRIDNMA